LYVAGDRAFGNDNSLVNEARGDAVAIVVDHVVSLDKDLADLFLVQVSLVVGDVSDGNGGTHETPLAVGHHGIQRRVGVLVWWLAEVKVGVDHGAGGQDDREDQDGSLHGGWRSKECSRG
jgi:hypothetical protein